MTPAELTTLGEKQELFSELFAKLIPRAMALGYRVRLGEVYRTPQQAALDAETGTGVANSVHCLKLAADIALFKGGEYLTSTEDYRDLGEWWKQQHPLCRWGGDFVSRPDGNHYSITHGGVE